MNYNNLHRVIDMAVLSKEDTGMDKIVYVSPHCCPLKVVDVVKS